MKKTILALSTLTAAFMFMTSCSKDKKTETPVYDVPTVYNFANVDHSNQAKLLTMADQIVAKINTANSIPNTPIDAQVLKDMLNNTGSYFSDSTLSLNNSGLKLSDYCTAEMKANLYNYFDSVALYSQSTVPASNGVAGVATTNSSPAKKILLSPTGVFYSQVVKKAMHAICMHQIADIYLKDMISNSVDNSTIVTGQGTAMEHNWDQAYGWFCVPDSFPTVTKGTKYLSSYSNQVNAGLGSNATLMNAFLKGRAAITAKDMTTKDAQAAILISNMEILNGACIVQEMHEINDAIATGNVFQVYSVLSETVSFIQNFKYMTNGPRTITDAQITQLLSLIDSSNPSHPNFYNFADPTSTAAQVTAKTKAISDYVGQIYGFSASQLELL